MASLLRWKKSFSGLMLVLFYIVDTGNGDIVDLTLVTNHPLLDPPNTRDQYIGAYLGEKDASIRDTITFDRIIRTIDTARLPNYIDKENEGQRIRKLIFEQSNQTNALGAFHASFEYEGTTRITSTVVLMHNATILPERTTLTVHVGDIVTFAAVTNITEDDLRWRFNGDGISDSRGKQSLTLENVQLNQTGVYKCFAGERWDAGNAIFLLHVIRCQAHRWGSECEHTCTECLNGGICDADSGECVCPPGFNGTTCEHVLGSNRFGQDGSFSCDSSGDDHSPGCRGNLFCLPDPFGCTCAAGFMGINCTTECNPGTYGADCLQECHCSPRNICSKDTGECMDGTACQECWTGVNCQVQSSPIQDVDDDSPPASVEALQMSPSTTQIKVGWELSSSQCSPDYYIIRYRLYQKLACQSPETTPTEFEVITNVTQYNNLVGLEPYSRYQITVIAVNGAGQSEPAIGYSDTRPGPPSNITNVRVNPERTSPSQIGFTWQPLNCRNVNGVFSYYFPRIYKDGDRGMPAVQKTYLDDDMSYSSIEFNGLEACTMYELNINAGNRDVSAPEHVALAIGVTEVPITNVSAYASGNQPSLTVQWSVPSKCNVDYYRLSYQLISRKACQDIPVIDAPVYELNVTSGFTNVYKYLSNLEYYATYNISIKAVMRRAQSLPMNVSGDTRDGDPTGPPTNIQSTSTKRRSIVFTWEKPQCGYRNGPISSYEVMLSNSTGDVVYHGNVSRPEHEIYGLIPYSNYSIRIRAWNYELAGVYGPAIWAQTDEATGVPSGSIATAVGSAVGAILVIVIVIILIIIFCKGRSDASATTESKRKEFDSSPQHENPVFDQSKIDVHTYQDPNIDTHTYQDRITDAQRYENHTDPHINQDLNTDAQTYENLTDHHTYQDLKKYDQEATYEDLTDAMNRDYVNVLIKN